MSKARSVEGSSSSLKYADHPIEFPPEVSTEEKIFGPSMKGNRIQDESSDLSSIIPCKLIIQAFVIVIVAALDFFLLIYAIINARNAEYSQDNFWSAIGSVLFLVLDVVLIILSYKFLIWFQCQLNKKDSDSNIGGAYQTLANNEPVELKKWSDLV